MLVYSATNLLNNKQYIGYTTTSLGDRMKTHKYKAHGNTKKYHSIFRLAIRKHGWDNFKWRILYVAKSKEDAIQKEIELIAKYDTLSPNGYNISIGGNGGKQPDEIRKRASETYKRRYAAGEIDRTWLLERGDRKKAASKKAWATKKGRVYPYSKRVFKENHKIGKHDHRRIKIFAKNIKTMQVVEFIGFDKSMEILGINTDSIRNCFYGTQSHCFDWVFSRNNNDLDDKIKNALNVEITRRKKLGAAHYGVPMKKKKYQWFNEKTNEMVIKSVSEMAKLANVSTGLFTLLKKGETKKSRTGWAFVSVYNNGIKE